jgi:hypothetical protein
MVLIAHESASLANAFSCVTGRIGKRQPRTICMMLGGSRDRSQGARMDLPGSTYLATLAIVATTYVGFAALLVGLRQAKGSRLTSYDAYFTLTFIQLGFIVTVSGLVPSLIALYGWPASVVWRVSSLIAAIPILAFAVRLPARRRAATGLPVPGFVKTLLAIQAAAAFVLCSRR